MSRYFLYLLLAKPYNTEAVMGSSMRVFNKFFFSKWTVLIVPLVYGSYLAWQEQIFRSVQVQLEFAPLNASAPAIPQPFQPQAIAAVFGLAAQDNWVPSAEPLQWRASFVSSQGASQALLGDGQSARFYAEGERLPSGSVLRRIEVDHVVLWRNGREERLAFKPQGQHVLPVSAASGAALQAPSLYLRPTAEQP